MSLKSALIAASLLVASATASAVTPISLTLTGPNQWSGSFTALASGNNDFSLDLSALSGFYNINLISAVTANFSGGSGYDVTAVTFNAAAFNPQVNIAIPGVFGADAWTYSANNIAAAMHSLTVNGNLVGGNVGFTGSVNIQATPVPEPETYALLLAGLAAVGFIARRRKG